MSGSVLKGLLKAWTEDPKGRGLLVAWAVTATGVTLRAVLVRRAARKAAAEAPSTAVVASATPAANSFRAVLRLAVPGWRSKPVAWCALLTAGIGLRLIVQVKTSAEIGALGSLLAKRDWPVLYRRQLTYGLMAIPAALTAALQKYAVGNMALSMRANLTAELHGRYAAAASLPASLASVESGEAEDGGVLRGTADVAAYCAEAVSLYEALVKPSVEVVLLSGKLATMMGSSQLLQCYAFFAVAGSWTRLVAPSFATLASDVQAADGALLAHRSRLHAYAEEIMMLRGLPAETAYMDEAASSAHATSARLHLQRFGSDVLDNYVLR